MRGSISKVIVAGLAALATVAPLAPTTTSASAAGTGGVGIGALGPTDAMSPTSWSHFARSPGKLSCEAL